MVGCILVGSMNMMWKGIMIIPFRQDLNAKIRLQRLKHSGHPYTERHRIFKIESLMGLKADHKNQGLSVNQDSDGKDLSISTQNSSDP